MYIMFSLNYLTVKELSIERQFIVWAAKLNQPIYFKSILTPKFGSKYLLLWKRGAAFVSIEDENLWIHSRLMCLMHQDPLKCHCEKPLKDTSPNKQQEVVKRTLPKFPK